MDKPHLMLIILLITAFIIGTFLIYQIALGFPLISIYKDKKRQKLNDEIHKIQIENEEKIKLLNKHLKTKDEIENFITLNRFNLPMDKEWKALLPDMINDLQSIGWSTDIPIRTKYSYGNYSIWIQTTDKFLTTESRSIFDKYLARYEGLWEEE